MVYHEGTKDTKDTKVVAMGVSQAVIGGAIEVHRHLGPGLLESVYEAALCRELSLRGLQYQHQVRLPIRYKDALLDSALRIDLIVQGMVLVEVKSVDKLAAIHRAQLLTYLRLTNHIVGLLINFNVELLRHGIRRVLNG